MARQRELRHAAWRHGFRAAVPRGPARACTLRPALLGGQCCRERVTQRQAARRRHRRWLRGLGRPTGGRHRSQHHRELQMRGCSTGTAVVRGQCREQGHPRQPRPCDRSGHLHDLGGGHARLRCPHRCPARLEHASSDPLRAAGDQCPARSRSLQGGGERSARDGAQRGHGAQPCGLLRQGDRAPRSAVRGLRLRGVQSVLPVWVPRPQGHAVRALHAVVGGRGP
mmetsp:Transcript_66779/g.189574  ORF Transcript_66779/g.189574 Transcript_66779/m.189574 type:complete len:225 (+) Transcript_66779:311-985(+)